jgi:hypothetical protein
MFRAPQPVACKSTARTAAPDVVVRDVHASSSAVRSPTSTVPNGHVVNSWERVDCANTRMTRNGAQMHLRDAISPEPTVGRGARRTRQVVGAGARWSPVLLANTAYVACPEHVRAHEPTRGADHSLSRQSLADSCCAPLGARSNSGGDSPLALPPACTKPRVMRSKRHMPRVRPCAHPLALLRWAFTCPSDSAFRDHLPALRGEVSASPNSSHTRSTSRSSERIPSR